MSEERAAVTIQKHFRGHVARKVYYRKLLALFEEEEERRREKEKDQMLEGEILLEKRRLHNSIADIKTLNHNEERLMNMMAVRIQQAWRSYKENRDNHSGDTIAISGLTVGDGTILTNSEQLPETNVLDSSESLDLSSNGDSNCSTHKQTHLRPNSDIDGDLCGTHDQLSVAQVEQLAHRVKTALFQDDRTIELEMFESLEDVPFEKQSDSSSCLFQYKLPSDAQRQSQGGREHMSTRSCVEISQWGRTAFHKESEGLLDTSNSKISSLPDGKSHDMFPTHDTVLDSGDSERCLENDLTASTSCNHLPTSVKTQDEDNVGHKGVATGAPVEERYRLCYTIELSDSSSQEDEENGSKVFEGLPRSDMEANYNASIDHDYHQDFEDFVSDGDSAIPKETEQGSDDTVQVGGVFETRERKHLDHSDSLLFVMSLHQLRRLFLTLRKKLNDHSANLVQLLKERDVLRNENQLLKSNIARMAGSVQRLHSKY